jgi:uncharacterized protein
VIETIKSMILDFQELSLETGMPRRLRVETIPGKATVLMGVRRSGKSTYLFQIMDRLLREGLRRENILYLNFFDDRLHNLKQEGLRLVTEAYYSLYPEKKGSEKVFCFFDKIQTMEGWEPFVDRLMRTENCEVFLTGSSARMLSKEIATQMRGRALSWEIFPFSFSEFLAYRGVDSSGPLSTKKRLLVQKGFDAYWETGGFPEVARLERRLRIKIHQEYFEAVLFRDLVDRHNISHPKALMALAHRLMENISSLYSINSLTGYLKSLGHNAPKSAVSDYLQWFEDAYFLFTVPLFDASVTRSKANPKKIYCVDHGLVPSIASSILLNSGHLLENLVFSALRRVSDRIFYGRTKSSHEVDFVVLQQDRSVWLIQACESLIDPRTRNREVASLSEAMAEMDVASGTIVTRAEEEEIKTASGIIKVVAAWRFLLDMPGP